MKRDLRQVNFGAILRQVCSGNDVLQLGRVQFNLRVLFDSYWPMVLLVWISPSALNRPIICVALC